MTTLRLKKPSNRPPLMKPKKGPAFQEPKDRRPLIKAATEWLATFPAFQGDPRPVIRDINSRLNKIRMETEQPFARKDMSIAIRRWVKSKKYQAALVPGTRRIDLDGNETDDIVIDLGETDD